MNKIVLDVRVSEKPASDGFYHWIVFVNNSFFDQGKERSILDAYINASLVAKDAVVHG